MYPQYGSQRMECYYQLQFAFLGTTTTTRKRSSGRCDFGGGWRYILLYAVWQSIHQYRWIASQNTSSRALTMTCIVHVTCLLETFHDSYHGIWYPTIVYVTVRIKYHSFFSRKTESRNVRQREKAFWRRTSYKLSVDMQPQRSIRWHYK